MEGGWRQRLKGGFRIKRRGGKKAQVASKRNGGGRKSYNGRHRNEGKISLRWKIEKFFWLKKGKEGGGGRSLRKVGPEWSWEVGLSGSREENKRKRMFKAKKRFEEITAYTA